MLNGEQIRPESTPPVPTGWLCFSWIDRWVYSIWVRLTLYGTDDSWQTLQFEISNNWVDWRDYTIWNYFSVIYGWTTFIRNKSLTPIYRLSWPYYQYYFEMESVQGVNTVINVSWDPWYLHCRTSTTTIPDHGLFAIFNWLNKADFNWLVLPATTLGVSSYNAMFQWCSKLTIAPRLPATTLDEYTYANMFYGCESLQTPPSLPAINLALWCYQWMFDRCSSLNSLPQLPAANINTWAYAYMFDRCPLIKISETQTWEYQTPYRIPTNGTGADIWHDWLEDMFRYTGWAFTWTPNINQTYYTSNAVI